MRKQSAVFSVCIHFALFSLLLLLASLPGIPTPPQYVKAVLNIKPAPLYSPPLHQTHDSTGAASGGGHNNPLPPNQGEIPRLAKVFLPPMLPPPQTPQITLPAGIEDIPQIATTNPTGIPTGIFGANSPGPGHGAGIGTGCCNGAGPGPGGPGGDGPFGPGGSRTRRPSVQPKLLWKTEPEYTEEARKARYQGSVFLVLEVDSDGKPRNIRVVHSLGFGLDERAVEAVAQWRFKPGLLDGKPVSAPVSVEVSFRLL